MLNFCIIDVDNCESLLDTAFGSFLEVRLFFAKKDWKMLLSGTLSKDSEW